MLVLGKVNTHSWTWKKRGNSLAGDSVATETFLSHFGDHQKGDFLLQLSFNIDKPGKPSETKIMPDFKIFHYLYTLNLICVCERHIWALQAEIPLATLDLSTGGGGGAGGGGSFWNVTWSRGAFTHTVRSIYHG